MNLSIYISNNLPPGCTQRDIDGEDLQCVRCGRTISEDEVDEDLSEAFETVCDTCGCAQREMEGEV